MKIDIRKFDFSSDKILSSLSKDEREAVLNQAEELVFRKGQLLFYEGGIPTGIFLLKSGRAKIFKTGADGKDQIFYIYKSGDLLGYHALLCQETYEDSCEALEECKVLFINNSKFQSLLDTLPKLDKLFMQNMSHEFGVLVNTITILAQRPVRQRVALYLLILSEKYKDQGGITLPREDLANIIGTARESLGRLLKEFKQEDLIEINRKVISIKNSSKLLSIASNY